MRKSPVPWYLPLERRFVIASQPAGYGMDWYGRSLLAFGAAIVAGGLVYVLSRRARWLTSPSAVTAVAHAGGLVLLVDFVYFGWALMTRAPTPWPLPSWYCPR
jgi:hypothetical protein